MSTISVGTARKSAENKIIYGAKDFIVPDYVGETLRTFLAQGISLFLLATERIQKYLERINGFRETFIQRGWKYSERHPLRAVPEEDFLHKKINTRDVFVVYGWFYSPEEWCVQFMEIWHHWTWRRGPTFQKPSIRKYHFFLVKLGGYFWLVYFVFSLVLVGIQGLVLVFPPISQLLQATWSGLI